MAIREQLNHRLIDGESAARILPWLNALPETIKLLEEDFEGLRINDNNLSDWRLGGYQDWLKRRERLERTREMAQWSVKLARANGGNLTEGAAAILTGQILEVLEGAAEPMTPEGFASLTKALIALRSGDHSQKVIEQNNRRLAQNDRKIEQLEKRLKLQQEAFLIKTADPATIKKVAAVTQDPSLNNEQKIAALRKIYFADVDAMEQSGEVKLPD